MSRPILIFINLFIALAIGLVFIWPKYQDLRVKNFEIEQKKNELRNKEEYFSELNKISLEFENYKENLVKIGSALPESPSVPVIFDFLQKASSQSGLVLKDISFSTAQPVERNIQDIEINVLLSGSYSGFKNLLLILEKSARLFEIKNIAFSPGEKGESLFDFNLTIKTQSY